MSLLQFLSTLETPTSGHDRNFASFRAVVSACLLNALDTGSTGVQGSGDTNSEDLGLNTSPCFLVDILGLGQG